MLVLFSSIVLFAQDCFGYLVFFVNLYELEGFIFCFMKNVMGILILIAMNL